MVIKEAMACNLPIVATDVGDVAGGIRDTAGCYLTAPTVESVADKLASALAFGGRTDGRSRIRHLSGAAAAQQVLAVYHEVLR